MKRKNGERIGCALLAAQMLLAPVAEAASPIQLKYYQAPSRAETKLIDEALKGSGGSASSQEKIVSAVTEPEEVAQTTEIPESGDGSLGANDGNMDQPDAQNSEETENTETIPISEENDGDTSASADHAVSQGEGDTVEPSVVDEIDRPQEESGSNVSAPDDNATQPQIDATTDMSETDDPQPQSHEKATTNATEEGTGIEAHPVEDELAADVDSASAPVSSEEKEDQLSSEKDQKLTRSDINLKFAPLRQTALPQESSEMGLLSIGDVNPVDPAIEAIYIVYGYPTDLYHQNETYDIELEGKAGYTTELKAKSYYRVANAEFDDDDDWIESELFSYRNGKTYYLGTLPAADDLARFPNLELTGWHVVKFADFQNFLEKTGKATITDYSMLFSSGDDSEEIGAKRTYLELANDPENPVTMVPFVTTDGGTELDQYISYADETEYGEYVMRTLMLIGKWDASTNATATDLRLYNGGNNLTLYPAENETAAISLAARTRDQLAEAGVNKITAENSFPTETTSYFTRVSADVDHITFQMDTYEPGSQLEIQVKSVNNSSESTVNYTTSTYTLNHGLKKQENQAEAKNSYANPARGTWSMDGSATLPLGAANETTKCNIITFTITPPSELEKEGALKADGTVDTTKIDTTKQKTYTVYVQRVIPPRLALKPGNTPAGMIMRSSWSDAKKATALAAFVDAPYQFTSSNILEDPINNNGHFQLHPYDLKAWGSEGDTNYDLDPGAIVIYQNDTFVDPGFVVYDGVGDPHDSALDTGLIGVDLTWKLELKAVTTLGPDAASDSEGTVTEATTFTGTGIVGNSISLVGLDVRPGIYQMNFTYHDPYELEEDNSHTFGDDASDADKTFARTVIVLPIPGDVDMDGAVTLADGVALQKLVNDGFEPNPSDKAQSLYWYRVCVAKLDNQNSEIAAHNASLLKSGTTPQLWRTDSLRGDYYYLPLNMVRQPWISDYDLPGHRTIARTRASVGTDENKASVSLKYLGVDVKNEETGETAFVENGQVSYIPSENQVFWTEIQIKNVSKLSEAQRTNLTGVTLTLTYDPDYVTPYYTGSDWAAYLQGLSSNNMWSAWTNQSSNTGITPVAHYSKAIPTLDQSNESKLKELRFSLTGSGVTLSGDGDDTCTLLRVPFRLKGFPSGKTNQSAQLVGLTLGMRDLVMTTATSAAVWNNVAGTYGLDSVTTNFDNKLQYGGSDPIPLGEDLTPSYVVYDSETGKNPVYGDSFTSSSKGVAKDLEPQSFPVSGDLPSNWNGTFGGDFAVDSGESDKQKKVKELGLEYNPTARQFKGWPNKAGTYYFTFNLNNGTTSVTYRLVVEKAPLKVMVQSVTKYYGESATVGSTTRQYFKYDNTQIKTLDSGKVGVSNTGDEADLTALLDGYARPTMTLVESVESNKAIDEKTHPGTYVVKMTGGSSANYDFRYPSQDENAIGYGTADLTILKRPVKIGKLSKSPLNDSTVWASTTNRSISGTTTEFDFADLPSDSDYPYAAPLLNKGKEKAMVNGESLQLDYTAEIQFKDGESSFVLTHPTEERDAEVKSISLTANAANNEFYTLLTDDIYSQMADRSGKAIVTKTGITKLEVVTNPSVLEYTYGGEGTVLGKFNVQGLKVRITTSDGNSSHEPEHRIANLISEGLTVRWVGEGEDGEPLAPTETDPLVTADDDNALQMTHKEHDGKYLCIYSTTGTADPVYIGPYIVHKKTLTLTLDRVNAGDTDGYENARYYGEDFPAWVISYNRTIMTDWEKTQFSGTTGKISDFTNLSGFKAPVVETRAGKDLTLVKVTSGEGPENDTWTFTGADLVTKATDIGSYYVAFGGAESDNYTFEYVSHNAMTGGAVSPNSKSFGYEPIVIYPRPIVVQSLFAPVGSLFQDSVTNAIEHVTIKAVSTDPYTVSITLPNAYDGSSDSTAAATTYYSTEESYYRYLSNRMTLTADQRILPGDTLYFSYTGEFATDSAISGNYFDLGTKESKKVNVTVRDLQLTQSTETNSNRNYVLLFTTSEKARLGAPVNDQMPNCGTVTLRKVGLMQILNAPTTTIYEYGKTLNLSGLKVRLWYDDGNVNGVKTYRIDEVTYSPVLTDSTLTNSFEARDLKIRWESADGDAAVHEQQISVPEHSGKQLVVVGPSYISEDPIVLPAGTITVNKKRLDLSVVSQTSRYYGEPNGTYEFTFDKSQLAAWDQTRMGELEAKGSSEDLNTPATSVALETVNAPYVVNEERDRYVGPVFATQADTTSDTGVYNLELSGGSMANYEFNCKTTPVTGTITVEKRPIMVMSVVKSPVTSVSKGAISSSSGYSTEVTFVQGKTVEDDEGAVTTINDLTLATKTSDHLDAALVNNDTIAIKMTVKYSGSLASLDLGSDYEKPVEATVSGMTLVEGGQNYELVFSNNSNSMEGIPNAEGGKYVTASVYQRNITKIAVQRAPTKLTYTYGPTTGVLDLTGLSINVTYEATGSRPAETRPVQEGDLAEIYINYWPSTALPFKDELYTFRNAEEGYVITDTLSAHPAQSGDHLTIAKDATGFAHNGMYLMVSARIAAKQPFLDPVLVTDRNGNPVQIKVNPLNLTYALSAQPKSYDGTTEAAGTIRLTNVYPEDQVWVNNGQNTSSSWADASKGYVNPSSNYDHIHEGLYGNNSYGVKFTYVDPNVKWRMADPANDSFTDQEPVTATVSNITLGGRDKDNYAINSEVTTTTVQLTNRDKAPNSVISPIARPAPDTAINLWVDEHTNTIVVKPVRPVTDFYVTTANGYAYNDSHNRELHYEYALAYFDGEGNLVVTDFQDSPYFGGEAASVTVPEYEEDGRNNTRPEAVGVGGQTVLSGDTLFGTRTALPRDTQISALVRLSPTNNFNVSKGTSSVAGYDEDTIDTEAFKDAFDAAAEAAKAAVESIPEPEEETERLVERVEAPVIKTYKYRIDLVSATEKKNADGEKVYVPTLEEVWFTDTATFEKDKDLDRLVNNVKPKLYYGYYWDPKQSVKVELGDKLNLADDEIWIEVPTGDSGAKVSTLMNEGDTVRFYVPLVSRGGNTLTMPRGVTIEPDELVLRLGDDPVRLSVTFEPANVSDRTVYWKSSDESVVKVSSYGEVTIVGPGTATITVRSMLGGMTNTIRVTVLKPDEVYLPFADTMFNAGAEGAYMTLTEDGLFRPDRPITRKELVVIMEHFFRFVDGVDLKPLKHYLDVSNDAEYLDELQTLQKHGIIKGVSENMFAPNWYATRGEISTILCRMLMLPVGDDPNVQHAFRDATPDQHWAWAYIDALAAAGITKGTGNGEYCPSRILTRAEVATFIARILVIKLNLTADNLVVPADVTPNHWAYQSILLAVNGGAMEMAARTTP